MRRTSEDELAGTVQRRVLAETGGALTDVGVVHLKQAGTRDDHDRTGILFWRRG